MQTADVYIFHYFAHLTSGCNLPKLFVDCPVMLIVCFYKYNRCLVLSINCDVTFLTYLIEGLWIWTVNSACYWHVIGNFIPVLKFGDKNSGCCSCAVTQQWTCYRHCYSWFMWHWLFWKALLTGNVQRPNTFSYYLNNLTITPSTGSTLHRFCEHRKQKYIYLNKRTR